MLRLNLDSKLHRVPYSLQNIQGSATAYKLVWNIDKVMKIKQWSELTHVVFYYITEASNKACYTILSYEDIVFSSIPVIFSKNMYHFLK